MIILCSLQVFLLNAILAGFLAYLGDRLGVPLYYAPIIVFGGRLFQNFASIRRLIFNKLYSSKKRTMTKELGHKLNNIIYYFVQILVYRL